MDQTTYLERFKQVTEYMTGLTKAKNSDYAGPGNPFQNFNLIEIITSGRVSTSAGILVRMTDKLQRFANLLAKPPAVVGEAIEDTLLDLAVYSIIEYLWLTSGKAELSLPGLDARVPEGPPEQDPQTVQDFANDVEVAASYPMDASANTADDAYQELAEKVEKYGPASLTPSENLLLKMLISARLGAE